MCPSTTTPRRLARPRSRCGRPGSRSPRWRASRECTGPSHSCGRISSSTSCPFLCGWWPSCPSRRASSSQLTHGRLSGSMAQVDYFLKLKGIEGESSDKTHKNEIELLSWSWGATNAGSHASGSGGGAGKGARQDLHFRVVIHKASPKRFLACARREHSPHRLRDSPNAGYVHHEVLQV